MFDVLDPDAAVDHDTAGNREVRRVRRQPDEGHVARLRLECTDASRESQTYARRHEDIRERIDLRIEVLTDRDARRQRRPAGVLVVRSPGDPGRSPRRVRHPNPSVVVVERPATVVVRRPRPRLVGDPGPPGVAVCPIAHRIRTPRARLGGNPDVAVASMRDPPTVAGQGRRETPSGSRRAAPGRARAVPRRESPPVPRPPTRECQSCES